MWKFIDLFLIALSYFNFILSKYLELMRNDLLWAKAQTGWSVMTTGLSLWLLIINKLGTLVPEERIYKL